MGFKRSQVQVLSPRPLNLGGIMEHEKRKSIRIKKPFVAQYNSVVSQRWLTSNIRDISETGLSIFTDELFSADGAISVRIKFPNNPFNWLEINGKVIGSKEFVSGSFITRMQFIDLNPEQAKAIADAIAWFLKQGDGSK
ncbi:PilZ domain-containing protein [bacterium]|nr:MAG: PilZ domain-containing protein [bacterium]